ncbi:hypothetical protein EfmAA610_10200 [Enterococcus faecium]|nr:hypothetical protein EfmAA610_10200 [Enterococcus faecium]
MINVRRRESDKKKEINTFVIKCEEKIDRSDNGDQKSCRYFDTKLLYLTKKNVNLYR